MSKFADQMGVTGLPLWSLMEQTERGQYMLPTIQRDFVWQDKHIRDFIEAMKRGYPLGMITFWSSEKAHELGHVPFMDGPDILPNALYVLDGQQRITSLLLVKHRFSITREGQPIQRQLVFYNPFDDTLDLRKEPTHEDEICISDIAVQSNEYLERVLQLKRDGLTDEQERLKNLTRAIRENQVGFRTVGSSYSYEDVAQIFLAINSAGVKIGAIDMFFSLLASKFTKGFKDDILHFHRVTSRTTMTTLRTPIRCLAAAMDLSQTSFSAARMKKSIDRMAEDRDSTSSAWLRVKEALSESYSLLKDRGLENLKLLPNEAVLTPFAFYICRNGGRMSRLNTDLLFYWLLMASYHGRYSQSVNGRLDEDLQQVRKGKDARGLVEVLRKQSAGLKVDTYDLVATYSKRLLLLLYVLERNNSASDWFGGGLVSSLSLNVHHIFPQKYLRANGIDSDYDIDDICNTTLISSKANRDISAQAPSDYFETEGVDSTKLREHFVPLDESLWHADSYHDFLDERRKLLSEALSEFLKKLEHK